MELPWNICPFCGTPAPGMRRENLTLDEALRPFPEETVEIESAEFAFQASPGDTDLYFETESESEQFEEIPQSEEPEE